MVAATLKQPGIYLTLSLSDQVSAGCWLVYCRHFRYTCDTWNKRVHSDPEWCLVSWHYWGGHPWLHLKHNDMVKGVWSLDYNTTQYVWSTGHRGQSCDRVHFQCCHLESRVSWARCLLWWLVGMCGHVTGNYPRRHPHSALQPTGLDSEVILDNVPCHIFHHDRAATICVGLDWDSGDTNQSCNTHLTSHWTEMSRDGKCCDWTIYEWNILCELSLIATFS